MKWTIHLAPIILILINIIFSCSPKAENVQGNNNSNISFTSAPNEENDGELGSSDSEDIDNFADCKFDDGTYSATYTLDVDVQDCQVIQINFPNDGYLDDDHISYANISDDGSASVVGEDGKTYQIQIDN